MEQILDLLNENFPDSEINFTSPRNDNRHFELKIKSKLFDGLNRIERSQLVYKHLASMIGTDKIHAITMKLIDSNGSTNNK